MRIEVNGTSLYYETAGEGRPVILLHCNYASHKIYDVLTRQMVQNGFRVYAVDSRGHGKSQKHKTYDYSTMAEDIACFIRALAIGKPILYGYSDGGILGLLVAARYPELLSRLIVSGANLSMDGQTKKALRLIKFGYFITRDRRLRLILDQEPIPFETLHSIRVPTLVLAGEKDLIREEHTRAIAAAIPDSTLRILPGEGHGSYITHSDKLYPVIAPFLEETHQ
ncbi:MAG: alpha/beta hydrolase [Clostridiales bacterium]|nr:alpha/beta hydrolase [Clostridiales bacterium]